MTDEELRQAAYQANLNLLTKTYEAYLHHKVLYAEIESIFNNHNTATKIELLKQANGHFAEEIEVYGNMISGDEFIDASIKFLVLKMKDAKQRVYDITADAVNKIDDPDFLNDIL